MKNVILHIGTHKTGTTTIQQALLKNIKGLHAAGFDYFGINRLNSQDSDCSEGVQAVHGFFCPQFYGKTIQEVAGNGQIVRRHFNQLVEASSCGTVIFSMEDFFAYTQSSWRLDRLKEITSDWDIALCCYVRRQDAYYESTFQSMVNSGTCKLDFVEFLHRVPPFLYDWSKMLERYRRHFPGAKLQVGCFELAARNGLLEDFRSRLGLPACIVAGAENANQSLDSRGLLIKKVFNGSSPNPKSSKPTAESQLLTELLTCVYPLVKKDPLQPLGLFTSREREMVVEHFKETNFQLFQAFEMGTVDEFRWWNSYGLGRESFTPDDDLELHEEAIRYLTDCLMDSHLKLRRASVGRRVTSALGRCFPFLFQRH